MRRFCYAKVLHIFFGKNDSVLHTITSVFIASFIFLFVFYSFCNVSAVISPLFEQHPGVSRYGFMQDFNEFNSLINLS